jgi:hypothetical protein
LWTPYEGFDAVFPTKVYLMGGETLDSGEVLIEGFRELSKEVSN